MSTVGNFTEIWRAHVGALSNQFKIKAPEPLIVYPASVGDYREINTEVLELDRQEHGANDENT